MIAVNEVRATFLEFFRQHGHEPVPSSPLVPHGDPTLLFTNAGMVQFKDVFTGREKRHYDRAVTAQKCLRAGGKHNDLDNVGYTARHNTFFEMLGNFSFGDYFKDRAIALAWELTTRGLGLPADRLLVTVHSSDEEAAGLWRRIAGLADDRIIRIPTSDNFWSMGDTGPCGPCSEIFIDRGEDFQGGPPGSAAQDGERFLEFWNLVFMQFDQTGSGERTALPRPSIDTGLGLERMAAILQQVPSLYETDLFAAILDATVDLVGKPAKGEARPSFCVIADHLRAAAFLIADGVLPSNDGRGYVLRRIMRRAMRHAHLLGTADPLLHRLVPVLVAEMGQAFPELPRAQALIAETLKLEESRFREMLERGLRLLDDEVSRLADGAALPGEVAFRLYDTFGFPYDLTEDALRRDGRAVERAGFDAAMARQREQARARWSGTGDAATDSLWFSLKERFGATEFLGYATTRAQGRLLALVRDGGVLEAAEAGEEVWILVNQTPFYAEAGGQMGDSGCLTGPAGRVEIGDTQRRLGALHIHRGRVVEGRVAPGEDIELEVDEARRRRLRANHSATHLLHEALRRRLGEQVTQRGSLVAPDRLRFDFSYPRAPSEDDLAWLEAAVNRAVTGNGEAVTRLMAPQAAIEAGALALFGEKYGEEVRVVSMGRPTGEETGNGAYYSTELCGGTHVRRTGDIGAFKIVSEGAVAAGVRRIEALTGEDALAFLDRQARRVRRLAERLKTTPAELEARVGQLLDDRRALRLELRELRRGLAAGAPAQDGATAREIGDIKVVLRRLEGVPGKELRGMADEVKRQLGSGVVALVAVEKGKAAVVVAVSDDLTDRFNAIDLVRTGVAALGGRGGGGRPDMAQGGGPDAARAQEAVAAIEGALAAA